MYDGIIYAILQKYHIIKNFDDFPLVLKSLKCQINTNRIKNFFYKYYYCFDEKKSILKIIPINSIVGKCLIVYSENYSFFTKISYDFEHD